jgi:predicted ArsR family transcriptional regulator
VVPKQTLVRRVEALAALLEPSRRKVYRYVARQIAPVGRDQAAGAVGISRAMAAFHLDKLVDLGLLRAEYRRLSGRGGRGAGRPSKLYRRSRRRFGVMVPERDHELLARLLTESMTPSYDVTPTHEVAHRYGRSLGARARQRISNRVGQERLARCVDDVLEEVGFEPMRAGSGEVWARNCPFDPLSRRFPAVVCQTALAIVAGVIDGVGVDGLGVRRDERPDRCCVVLDATVGSATSEAIATGKQPHP